MEQKLCRNSRTKKPGKPTVRNMNRVIFRLRALQMGLSLDDLDCVTCGQLLDLMTEAHNDKQQWPVKGDGAMLRKMFM